MYFCNAKLFNAITVPVNQITQLKVVQIEPTSHLKSTRPFCHTDVYNIEMSVKA